MTLLSYTVNVHLHLSVYILCIVSLSFLCFYTFICSYTYFLYEEFSFGFSFSPRLLMTVSLFFVFLRMPWLHPTFKEPSSWTPPKKTKKKQNNNNKKWYMIFQALCVIVSKSITKSLPDRPYRGKMLSPPPHTNFGAQPDSEGNCSQGIWSQVAGHSLMHICIPGPNVFI